MADAPHLLHVFPSFEAGGSQRRTTALMAGLGARYRHTVLSLSGDHGARTMLPEDFPLATVEWPGVRGFWRSQRAFGDVLRRTAPDLVCTYNWGAIEALIAATRQLGLPAIHHEDGFGPDEVAGQKARRVWTRRVALRKARAVCVPSHVLGDLAARTWKVPSHKLHVLANGVELERFGAPDRAERGAAFRAAHAIPKDAFVVGTVGTLRPEKNHVRFVRALAQARAKAPEAAWHAVIVGEGAERPALEAAIAEAGLDGHVTLAGYLADCAPALFAMDLFALSSNTEQMPISLVEAMAAHLPVTSTDVGDVARMLPTGTDDLLIALDVADPAGSLAESWVALAKDPTRRRTLGAAGRALAVERYSVESMLAAYAERYDAALAKA